MSSGNSTEYEKRINEIEYFFSCVETMYDFFDQKQSSVLKKKLDTSTLQHKDFVVILKANSILMLYNLIESTVRSFIQKIYDEVTLQELVYDDISEKLQKVWIDISYKKLKSTTTNFDQHKSKAIEMINDVINQKKIKMTESDIYLSGNVDIKMIKSLFENHGVNIPAVTGTRVGQGLITIKTNRNLMAHGNISFIDSARDLSFDDLKLYKNQIIDYLNLLDVNVNHYIEEQNFKCPS